MRKFKIYLLIFFGIIFFIPSFSVLAVDPIYPTSYRLPLVEVLHLKVDGNATHPSVISTTVDFDWISRVVWSLSWEENSINFDHFAGGDALDCGIHVLVNGENITAECIKTIADFARDAYDITILSDDKNPIENHLVSRWSFFKLTGNDGIDVRNPKVNLNVHVHDNLTDVAYAIDHFDLSVQGYKTIDVGVVYSETWVDDVSNFDSITDYLLCFLLLPLILMSSSDELTFWFGVGILIIEICVVLGTLKHFIEGMIL